MSFQSRHAHKHSQLITGCAAIAIATVLTSLAAAETNDWPAFRGVRGDGISTTQVFSNRDNVGLKVSWKKTIGSGYSGVSIAEGHVVTMFSDGTHDVAVAFNETTGNELWRFEIEPTYEGHDGSHTGPITTPLIADGRVFGLGAKGRLFALDLKTGKEIWSSDLIKDFEAKKPHYGFSTSPLMVDGVLILELGKEDAAVVGLDPATGKQLWAAGGDSVGYQSPVTYVHANGDRELLVSCNKKIYGITPKTGKVQWEFEHGGKGATGASSVSAIPVSENRIFIAYDNDESMVFEVDRKSDPITVKSIWKDGSIRGSYNVPVHHDGYIYAYSTRFLTCVDAKTGERKWRSRKPGDGFLVLVDGHLVIVTKDGSLHVAKASPEKYEEISQQKVLDEISWAHPSFANGHIYVRSLGEIARVEITSQKNTMASNLQSPAIPADSKFAKFLKDIKQAKNKKRAAKKFIASIDQFPLIEGDDLVHFIYFGRGNDIAMGSDLFGLRQLQPMTRVAGTKLFYYSTKLEPDARVNYMFTRDFDKQISDPRNNRKVMVSYAGKDMSFGRGQKMEMSWVAMPQWKAPTHLDTADASRQGRLDKKEFESKILETKLTFDVYVPVGYDNSKDRYPVAYIFDAKGALDGGQYQRTLDNIIGNGVAPLIAVFIPESPPGKGEQYAQMFSDELIPFVDKEFRTIASANHRATIGTGFTGGAALTLSIKHSDLFNKIGLQSVAFFDYPDTLLKEKPSLQVYLEWGKYDLRNPHENWDSVRENRKLYTVLRDHGYQVTGGEVHDGTGWPSWKNRTDVMFKALFPEK